MPSCVIPAPFGMLRLEEDAGAIIAGTRVEETARPASTPLLKECARQLQAYFDGRLQVFDLPLRLEGTAFRMAAWHALTEIHYGQTRTYAQLAAMCGNERACRAVGGAIHHNPIAIIVPCHRVIGADGSLTCYAGGIERKAALLRLEQVDSHERKQIVQYYNWHYE